MDDRQFAALRSAAVEVARRGGTWHDVGDLVVQHQRALEPRHGRELHEAVLAAGLDTGIRGNYTAAPLLASFLSRPTLWARLPYEVRHRFWNDRRDGCAWANMRMGPGASWFDLLFERHARHAAVAPEARAALANTTVDHHATESIVGRLHDDVAVDQVVGWVVAYSDTWPSARRANLPAG